MRFGFYREAPSVWPVAWLCEALEYLAFWASTPGCHGRRAGAPAPTRNSRRKSARVSAQ